MLVELSSYAWASAEDIPGSRCGPEDGPWPRPYQVLTEPELLHELRRLAKPQTFVLEGDEGYGGEGGGGVSSYLNSEREKMRVDCVNFQPSFKTRTQDRYVVRELEIWGRMWSLTGVFDGHLGDATVEHVAYHLPVIIQDFIGDALLADPTCGPASIAEALARAIVAFDETLAQDVLDLFGGSVEDLDDFSDGEIRSIINDQHEGGANWRRVRLCMYGTTALVALVDPDRRDLWVANLGDCQAVMVSQNMGNNDGWTIEKLTTDHNGDNDAEIERVRQAHPGEPECVLNGRVLGALAPTRCLGDIPFKQPPAFTRRIIYNLFPGFHDTSPWEDFLLRNHTPPYITALPEVAHRRLDKDYTWADSHDPAARCTRAPRRRFLILSSDGFADICGGESDLQEIVQSWARSVPADEPHGGVDKKDNMALELLRKALGGEDRYKVSSVLTLDMDVAWIDDTSIVVQTI